MNTLATAPVHAESSSATARIWCHGLAFTLLVQLLLLAVRLIYINHAPYDLYGDETQYWGWSKELAFGYYSKPPIVAWVIALTTHACGDGPLCVKLGSPIAYMLTSIVVYFLGRELWNARVGTWASLIFSTLPSVTLSSSIISTDPFLVFFWAAALYAFVRVVHSDGWGWWFACGAALGGGMMSKYNMCFFVLSAALYFWTNGELRARLRSPKPWVTGLLALALFAPNMWWNAQNGFVSLLHTRDNASPKHHFINIGEFLEFFGSQFTVQGPLLFAVLLSLLWAYRKRLREQPQGLLICFILPLLAFITAIALISRAKANWAAPVYVPATLLVVAWLLETTKRRRILIASLVMHCTAAAAFYFYLDVANVLNVTLTHKNDPFTRVKGWRALGDEMSALKKAYPGAALFTDDRKTTAGLLYYMHPSPRRDIAKLNLKNGIDDHYELTTNPNTFIGRDVLYVARLPLDDRGILRWPGIVKLRELRLPINSDSTLDYDVYLIRSFRGYDGPSPKPHADAGR